jgi:hypothetical protein
MSAEQFQQTSWIRFPRDQAVAEWVLRARPVAERCVADAALRARWMRCGGTWFIGVNVLPNDTTGAIASAGVPPLEGAPVRFIEGVLELPVALDHAQVSVCFPGYPQPSAEEPEAAFRFRRERDAAHVDGVRRSEGRRRRLGDSHGFILGLPLTNVPPDAAPLVVWEGSHEVIRNAFRARLQHLPPERWADEDITDAYVAARRECFERCRRVLVHAEPGEAYVVHRLALHGIAPWRADNAGKRVIAYFRPNPFPGRGRGWWLERP